MVTTAAAASSGPWSRTEVEALQLEYTWIKEFDPRFNVKYRDDKSYPSLAVTLNEEFPRLQVMRGAEEEGRALLRPLLPRLGDPRDARPAAARLPGPHLLGGGLQAGRPGRPAVPARLHRQVLRAVRRPGRAPRSTAQIVDDFCDFMAGQTGPFLRRLEKDMQVAAANQEYERAARLRDDIKALERAVEKQAVVLGDGTDADVVALAEDPLEAAVQVFYVRGGRVRGQRGWVVDKVEDLTTGDLVEHFLQQLYGDGGRRHAGTTACRARCWCPRCPTDAADGAATGCASCRGSNVDLRVPQRGDKRALMETVARNAAQSLALHKTKRGSDLTTRSLALQEIQEALGLDEAPLRIECYDVSHLQESDVVASMVVFEDGLARKSEYRRFVIRGLRRPRRRRVDPRGDQPAVPPLPRRAGRDRRGRRSDGLDDGRAADVPGGHRPGDRPAAAVRLPARTSSSSTAVRRRWPRRSRRSTSSASTTSRCAGWPSGSRRSGCPATRTRSCCRAPARASTCCSGCATRRTGSPSPTTGSAGPSR